MWLKIIELGSEVVIFQNEGLCIKMGKYSAYFFARLFIYYFDKTSNHYWLLQYDIPERKAYNYWFHIAFTLNQKSTMHNQLPEAKLNLMGKIMTSEWFGPAWMYTFRIQTQPEKMPHAHVGYIRTTNTSMMIDEMMIWQRRISMAIIKQSARQ